MTARHAEADEETPLLRSESRKPNKTPIPWGQFTILLICQLAEPLTSQVINPFAPELIRSLGITHGDETKVGYYVGVMQSIFYATQAITVMHWSRISDHVGRKPVFMTGLMGLSLSMYCFGLSRTFWGAVISRSLNGALNGNIGVMKSMLAEITDSTNIAQAYAFMPIAWSTGATLGPAIGGTLSHPAERHPDIFGQYEFLKKYPYFLACSIPATFSMLACFTTLFFLKETVRKPVSLRTLLRLSPKEVAIESSDSTVVNVPTADDKSGPLPLKRLLVPRVIIPAANYAFLAIVDITLRAIQPVFYATPITLGGLGLNPQEIGWVLSVYGVINGFIQLSLFSRANDRFGSKRVYLTGIAMAVPVFALFPVINDIARAEGMVPMVWGLVIGQALLSIAINFSYGAVFIFITASAPNKASLGCSSRSCAPIGPATANSLFSLSIDQEHHYMGGRLVYYALSAIVLVAFWVGTLLPTDPSYDLEDNLKSSSPSMYDSSRPS
ncbi:MFS general substrate transporter [Ganoderma leucocontextum]|nr:MFS general substrate transporter [Ganoderma leucocontextum]